MLEKFHFETSEGEKIAVHHMKDVIRRKALRKIQKDYADRPEEQDDALFEAAGFDKKTLDIIENMTMRDYENFVKGWSEQDGASLGES